MQPTTSHKLPAIHDLQMLLIPILLLLALLPGHTVSAQVPERQRAFVYGINAAVDQQFFGSFAPPTTTTIYLMADQTSILSPRTTEIYFWPITNEYQASWEVLNQAVPGTLEIVQGTQVIAQTQPTSYTLHYQQDGPLSTAQLFTGQDAVAAHERFTAEQRSYQAAQRSYQTTYQQWLEAAADANRRIAAGEKNVTIGPEPVAPTPISVTSNGLNEGIPVNLPVGSYRIRMRAPDGTIVPTSERTLEVFRARRSAIGYQVVPEARWTTPEQLQDPNAVIIGNANSQLYLVPHQAREYPARAYALLQNPQKPTTESSEWVWVAGVSLSSGELELVTSQGERLRRPLTPFRVQQMPGSGLGYQILPFTPDPQRPNAVPDLTAFPVPLRGPGSAAQIQIVQPDGQILAGSERMVRTPAALPLWSVPLLTGIPLLAGMLIILRRRARMRLPRNIAG